MSEFDDFVTEEDESEPVHEPKKAASETKSADQSPVQQESPVTETERTNTAKTDAIEESTPGNWDREQFAMFFRESTVYEYEDHMYETEGELKREYSVRNSTRYELDQAFVELALERIDPDDVSERVLENRGLELER